MKLIVHKAAFFALNGGKGTIAKHHMAPRGPGVQVVPDWVTETDTFKIGVQDGSLAVIPEALPPGTVGPPTIDKVMEQGRSLEEATKIVAEETRKFEAGEYPYPPRTAAVETGAGEQTTPATLDNMVAQGLISQEEMQAILDARASKDNAEDKNADDKIDSGSGRSRSRKSTDGGK